MGLMNLYQYQNYCLNYLSSLQKIRFSSAGMKSRRKGKNILESYIKGTAEEATRCRAAILSSSKFRLILLLYRQAEQQVVLDLVKMQPTLLQVVCLLNQLQPLSSLVQWELFTQQMSQTCRLTLMNQLIVSVIKYHTVK